MGSWRVPPPSLGTDWLRVSARDRVESSCFHAVFPRRLAFHSPVASSGGTPDRLVQSTRRSIDLAWSGPRKQAFLLASAAGHAETTRKAMAGRPMQDSEVQRLETARCPIPSATSVQSYN